MTTVFIVRHAAVSYPFDEAGRALMYSPDAQISDEGRRQFTDFASELKKTGIVIDGIETSPFTRAVETAKILAEVFGVDAVTKNPPFSDPHIPGWIGLPLSEQQKLMDKNEDIYMNPRSPDQEPYEQVAARVFEGFKDLVRRSEGKTMAIVSHGDTIRLLVYRLEHPDGEIPNMSVLSKDRYLKRGEAFRVLVDRGGKIVETELVSNLKGIPGERERYS